MLLHKAIVAILGFALHVLIQLFGGGGHIRICHVLSVVHKQQGFKVQRHLVNLPLIGGTLHRQRNVAA